MWGELERPAMTVTNTEINTLQREALPGLGLGPMLVGIEPRALHKLGDLSTTEPHR